MAGRHYYNRRERRPWGRNRTLEQTVTAGVIFLLVAVFVVFLFIYHDVPLRVP